MPSVRAIVSFAQAGGPQAYFGWPAEASDEGQRIIESLGAILDEAVMDLGIARALARDPMPDPQVHENLTIVNPSSRSRPRGFSHGVLTPAGWRTLNVAGQTAADEDGHVVEREFVAQFDRALGKVVEVVRCAGGLPHHIARMTIYVTDLEVYAGTSRSARGCLATAHGNSLSCHGVDRRWRARRS